MRSAIGTRRRSRDFRFSYCTHLPTWLANRIAVVYNFVLGVFSAPRSSNALRLRA